MTNKKKGGQYERVCAYPVVKTHLSGLWMAFVGVLSILGIMYPTLIRVDERSVIMDKNLSYIVSRIDGSVASNDAHDSKKTAPIRFPDDVKSIKKLKNKVAISPISVGNAMYPTMVEVEEDD